MAKKKGLGRGLEALMDDFGVTLDLPGQPLEVRIACIQPNPYQPRRPIDDNSLKSLMESIKGRGVLQPLLVRKLGPDRYELIAGERRLRACRAAGLDTVPVIVREAGGPDLLEMALVENLHREDLNPIEIAEAYRRLGDEFQRTQAEIAAITGHDRSTVANLLRLLNLPSAVQTDVAQGRLSMGHARALLALKDEASILEARARILKEELSVRQTEALVKRLMRPPAPRRAAGGDEAYFEALADRMTRRLGAKTRLIRRGKKGRIEIRYASSQELERLLTLLGVPLG
jgi:ParB family chromosome partitioning protein